MVLDTVKQSADATLHYSLAPALCQLKLIFPFNFLKKKEIKTGNLMSSYNKPLFHCNHQTTRLTFKPTVFSNYSSRIPMQARENKL